MKKFWIINLIKWSYLNQAKDSKINSQIRNFRINASWEHLFSCTAKNHFLKIPIYCNFFSRETQDKINLFKNLKENLWIFALITSDELFDLSSKTNCFSKEQEKSFFLDETFQRSGGRHFRFHIFKIQSIIFFQLSWKLCKLFCFKFNFWFFFVNKFCLFFFNSEICLEIKIFVSGLIIFVNLFNLI